MVCRYTRASRRDSETECMVTGIDVTYNPVTHTYARRQTSNRASRSEHEGQLANNNGEIVEFNSSVRAVSRSMLAKAMSRGS